MSTNNFEDVGEFHERFGLHRVWSISGHGKGPQDPPADLLEFRRKFLYEELEEFEEGLAEGNDMKMADALIDLVYVAMGTAHILGYPWQELWDDVQRANMSKVRAAADGTDSKRGSAYDVVKPEGWRPPDTAGILGNWGYRGCMICNTYVPRTPGGVTIATDTEDGERRAYLFCGMEHHDQWRAQRANSD